MNTTEINVICSECGSCLGSQYYGLLKEIRSIKVSPCRSCLRDSYREGKREGLKEANE